MVGNRTKTKTLKPKEMMHYEAFSKGNSLAAAGKYSEALVYLKKALELSPDDDVCINNIGICYFKLNKIDKCEQELRKALEIDSNNSLTAANLATCLSAQNKYKESLEYYKRGLTAYGNETKYFFNFAYAQYKMGDYRQAIKNLKKSIELDENNYEARILISECLLESNKYQEIINVIEKSKFSSKYAKKFTDFYTLAKQAIEYENNYPTPNRKTINSLCEFIEMVNAVSKKNNDSVLIYRGQRNKFHPLIPALFRNEKFKSNEDNIIQDFNLKADAYFNHEMAHFDNVDKIALMQHHGIPTRLLDFTESPLVALYFALENITNNMYNIAPCVYILNLKTFKHNKNGFILSSKQVSSPDDEKIFKYTKGNCAFSPKLKNKRLTAQKGVFILFNEEKALDGIVEKEYLLKLEIPFQKIPYIQEELNNLGITPSTIYPDFMGLAQEIKTPRNFAIIEDLSPENQFKYTNFI